MSADPPRRCVRCGEPVIANRDNYSVFEQMHWLCFHLEFEHQGDADTSCGDPGCPWWHIQVFRDHLASLGIDPDQVLSQAIKSRWPL